MLLSGTPIFSPLVPISDKDKYPTHFAKYGRGGYMSFNSVDERDSIPLERQEKGMMVSIDSFLYILLYPSSGLSEDSWYKLPFVGVRYNAQDINFNYSPYSDVSGALYDLLYEPLRFSKLEAISSYNNSGIMEHVGTDWYGVTLNWGFNKPVQFQSISNPYDGEYWTKYPESGVRSYNDNRDFTTSILRDYTISATSFDNETISDTISVKVLDRVYYGLFTGSAPTNAEILTCPNFLSDDKNIDLEINCSGKHFFICYPAVLKDSAFFVNDLKTDFLKSTFTFSNRFSVNISYKRYSSLYPINGTIKIRSENA